MRLVILPLFLSVSVTLAAQYDTSLITKAFEYIKTEEFKTELKNYTEAEISNLIATYPNIRKRANRFRKEERARMNFWIMNKCLAPDNFYFIPDSTGKFDFTDSITRKRFSKHDYNPVIVKCDSVIRVSFIFIDPQIIHLDYFPGRDHRIRFGESNILRLKIVGGKFQIISRETIFWN